MNTPVFIIACVTLVAAFAKEISMKNLNPDFEEKVMTGIELGSYEHLKTRQNENGLTDQQKAQLLTAHNKYRRQVNPPAENMQEVEWDAALASTAQSWADQCKWKHNNGRSNGHPYYVGENKYLTTSSSFNGDRPVEYWFLEYKKYDYSTNGCSSGICTHYTQVVWHNSNKVGCGMKRCSSMVGLSGWTNVLYYVCNYGPGGNYVGVKPYTSGTSCGNCPTDLWYCSDKLCSKTDCTCD